MILQSKEEPQLHTTMLIQDDKELSPSHIPDCDPPPYSHLTSGSAGVSAVTTDSEFANAPTVKDIIDPDESRDQTSALQGFAARHGDLVGLRKAADFLSAAPHAVFRNRFGSIFLTLATKGSSEQCHRAIIDVSTRHGDIAVNLVSKNSKLQLHNVVSYVLKTEFCTSW
jgi:hypothetical protein